MSALPGRSGNLTVKVDPIPRPLETLISPRIARTSCRVTHGHRTRHWASLDGSGESARNQRLVAIRYSDTLVANRQPAQFAIARQRDLNGPPRSESWHWKADFPRSARPPLDRTVRSPRLRRAIRTWQPALSAKGSIFAVTSRISADRSTSAVCRSSFPELARATSAGSSPAQIRID